jgi:hypothetical protein
MPPSNATDHSGSCLLDRGEGNNPHLVWEDLNFHCIPDDSVAYIARQQTGKHLATAYTHTTIELRMLLFVANQQSTPVKSLTRNYVTGFLWIRAVTIAMQRLDKRTFNNGATVFRGVRAEVLSWRPSALQSSSR